VTSLEALTGKVTALEGLTGKVEALEGLTGKVSALESTLSGVSNGDLTGALAKLEGISATELQEAVGAVATVTALCTQAETLTERADELGESFEGLSLLGFVPGVLELLVPQVPAALEPFGC
jgi:hypothetical protein